ncbi:MAG: hypothetical protein U5L06_02815 [Rhodovibrio sp.]|nr:hypothetical protein [Rhodovibrio sp.]
MKQPSWLGAMVIGPRLNRAYSSAMPALESQLFARRFSVSTPSTE